jgi:hypothetical protein
MVYPHSGGCTNSERPVRGRYRGLCRTPFSWVTAHDDDHPFLIHPPRGDCRYFVGCIAWLCVGSTPWDSSCATISRNGRWYRRRAFLRFAACTAASKEEHRSRNFGSAITSPIHTVEAPHRFVKNREISLISRPFYSLRCPPPIDISYRISQRVLRSPSRRPIDFLVRTYDHWNFGAPHPPWVLLNRHCYSRL